MAKRKFSAEIVIEPCKRPVGSALRIYDGDTLLASLHIPEGELAEQRAMCLIAYTDIGKALRDILPKSTGKQKKKTTKPLALSKAKAKAKLKPKGAAIKRKIIRRKQK